MISDRQLYERGAATLVTSWEAYAAGSPGAALLRLDGVAAGVFPAQPERAIYNNALLERDLAPAAAAAALEAMEAAYTAAGVERYAAWVHESQMALRDELHARGYRVTETTRAMGMSVDDLAAVPPAAELIRAEWADYLSYLRALGLPAGLLSGVEPTRFHALAARLDGADVATALALDHDGDCGLYNMSTLGHARRRGLATRLTAHHVHLAAGRGCTTASLQSTAMGEHVYAAVGFRDLGRIIEYEPGTVRSVLAAA